MSCSKFRMHSSEHIFLPVDFAVMRSRRQDAKPKVNK
jgi:hypothetical protein